MTNTFMLAGEDDPEDIIRSVDHGLYAVTFGGGQVDITSGKFVFSASEAYLIEDGKVTAPVKGATLIGHGPDALTRVTRVGRDLTLDEGVGTCGKDGQSVPGGRGPAHHPDRRHDRRRDLGLMLREDLLVDVLRRATRPRGQRRRRLPGRGAPLRRLRAHGRGGDGDACAGSAALAARLRGARVGGGVHVRSLARLARPRGGRGHRARADHRRGSPRGPARSRRADRRGAGSRPGGHGTRRRAPRGEDRGGPGGRSGGPRQ